MLYEKKDNYSLVFVRAYSIIIKAFSSCWSVCDGLRLLILVALSFFLLLYLGIKVLCRILFDTILCE